METKIANLMQKLNISREEALEILADDEAIEKGEKLFELSAEQKKASKEARQTQSKNTKKTSRERKADNEKRALIDLLKSAIESDVPIKSIEVTNIERQIDFETAEGRRFRIVLSAPRK